MIYTNLDFNGKIYISANRAGELTGYTNDYVGQLARDGKIKAKKIGRVWFVEQESILEHRKSAILSKKETGIVSPIYVYRAPVLFEKKALVPILISVFFITTFVFSPFGPKIVTGKFDVPSVFMPDAVSDLKLSLFDVNAKIKNLLESSVRTSSMVVMNVANSGSTFFNFFSVAYDYINSKIYELSIIVYRTVNKTYASAYRFVKKDNELKNVAIGSVLTEKQSVSQNGIVVLPATGDDSLDEKERKDIKESFSDEVNVVFDETGGSGIIKPVFKSNRDESYSFVLVPINSGI